MSQANKIVFFTDPHLGLKRSTGTTASSRKLLQERLIHEALRPVEYAYRNSYPVFCLGDLFDSCHNSEEVILSGMRVVQECDLVLGGNHDISNRVGDFSSLALIREAILGQGANPVEISPDPSNPYVAIKTLRYESGTLYVVAIPHCLSQEIFAECVSQACETAEKVKKTGKAVLLLHCNVGSGFGKVEDGGSTLWLTEELQEKALVSFEKVLVGHEHEARSLHSGRLLVLGNTFPVSYGEIGPRFMYEMDVVTTEIRKIQTVDPATLYLEVSVDTMLESGGVIETSAEMVQIIGKLKKGSAAPFARALFTFWKTNPKLLSVKNSSVTEEETVVRESGVVNKGTLKDYVREAAGPAGFTAELKEIDSE